LSRFELITISADKKPV